MGRPWRCWPLIVFAIAAGCGEDQPDFEDAEQEVRESLSGIATDVFAFCEETADGERWLCDVRYEILGQPRERQNIVVTRDDLE